MPPYTALQLLTQIAQHQRVASPAYPPGLLPSYRYNPAWRYHRLDQNLFFTAITAFTLQRLQSLLQPAEQALAQAIIGAAVATYPAFRNGKALPGSVLDSTQLGTYNFYATNPSRHFPNGWLMHRLRHFKLPDDIDDTAMVYLTSQPSPTDLDYLHRKLAHHANRTRRTVQNTFAEHQSLRAYSTWFGEQMPVEFDACALANMLYCVYEYRLPLDVHAQDSLLLLADMVQSDRYRTDPFRCAPNYARTPLIAYHLARLIAAHDPVPLRTVRPKLLRDLRDLLVQPSPQLSPQPHTRMDRLLLSTSLLRLGEQPAQLALDGIEAEFDRFSFFIAGMLSAFEGPLYRRLAPQPFWHIRWQCTDYCRVLLLEYLVLSGASDI